MASAAEAEAAKTRHGYIDPRAAAYRDYEARPLAGPLADWDASLIANGSTATHASLSRNRAGRVADLGRIRKLSELVPSRVQAAMKTVRDEGASLRSVHHYTRVI